MRDTVSGPDGVRKHDFAATSAAAVLISDAVAVLISDAVAVSWVRRREGRATS